MSDVDRARRRMFLSAAAMAVPAALAGGLVGAGVAWLVTRR